MKNTTTLGRTFAVLALVGASLVATQLCQGGEYARRGRVNDFAGLLSRDQEKSLEGELASFERRTRIEFVIVAVPTLDGRGGHDRAKEIAVSWNVGKGRGMEHGIVLLVAASERRADACLVRGLGDFASYMPSPQGRMGMEAAFGSPLLLTDARADDICSQDVSPYLRAGKPGRGILEGARAIMAAADPSAPVPPKGPSPSDKDLLMIIGSIIAAALVAVAVAAALSNKKSARLFES